MPSPWRSTFYIILTSLLVGGAAGVLGTAWTSAYLSDYAVELSKLTAPLLVSQERPRNFPSSYKEAVERFTESSLPSVAVVYTGAPGPLGFEKENRLGVAVVLTSDGWLAMPNFVYPSPSLKGAHVQIRSNVYPVLESLYDKITNVIFAKVEASGLPVASLGKGRETQAGEQVFVATDTTAFFPASVQAHVWPGGELVFSEKPNRLLLLNETARLSDVVFNLNGEVIAIVVQDNLVLPIEAVFPILRSVLETGEIIRPTLGVRYVDLTHAVDVPEALSRTLKNGALLYGSTSVPRTSPAYLAGLRFGDILISVNGEIINGEHGLDELISQYRPKDRVEIVFDRKGETMKMEVELGARKE